MAKSPHITHLDARTFTVHVEQSELPVAVEFWAPWCSPCRQVHAVLEEMAPKLEEQVAITRVDVDANAELAEAHAVHLVPTVLVFNRGRLVTRLQGRITRDELLAALQAAAAAD
jgi:thioredoxin 1